jgi:hypothetical protein
MGDAETRTNEKPRSQVMITRAKALPKIKAYGRVARTVASKMAASICESERGRLTDELLRLEAAHERLIEDALGDDDQDVLDWSLDLSSAE